MGGIVWGDRGWADAGDAAVLVQSNGCVSLPIGRRSRPVSRARRILRLLVLLTAPVIGLGAVEDARASNQRYVGGSVTYVVVNPPPAQ
jgi:hypothetical protein